MGSSSLIGDVILVKFHNKNQAGPIYIPTKCNVPDRPFFDLLRGPEAFEVQFVDVASDSRCASDMTCLWAGELVLRLAIRSKGKETQHEVRELQSVAVDGYAVTVLEALPASGPEAHRIDPADYRVTIKVTRAKSQ